MIIVIMAHDNNRMAEMSILPIPGVACGGGVVISNNIHILSMCLFTSTRLSTLPMLVWVMQSPDQHLSHHGSLHAGNGLQHEQV